MIVALVSVETLLLVLLVVLVAGLLRSHAEILRRLGPARSEADDLGAPSSLSRGRRDARAPAIAGPTPDGDAVKLDFAGRASGQTLLAFLTTGCTSCAGFWNSLSERLLPPDVQPVIVTRGPDRERLAALRSLAPPGVPVVMSSQAWDDYRVPGSPYFVLVDDGVLGEGVATTWQALASLVTDAIDDLRAAEGSVARSPFGGSAARGRHVDETLTTAGIGPDHPSLHPGRPPITTPRGEADAE